MSQGAGRYAHVGEFIRQRVLPRGMSVKDAAKTLGVGRPALSNLLNGNASLSPEMALRLEQAFRANRQELESLDGRTGVSSDEMAQLEFLFIAALWRGEHGIPNLERQIAESPALFVQAVALSYKRSDDGGDPPGWHIDDLDRRMATASAARRLLDQIRRIPGTNERGEIDVEGLRRWLGDVRQLCAQHGWAEIGDHCIGQLLSSAPSDKDGVWPSRAVFEAMETVASGQVSSEASPQTAENTRERLRFAASTFLTVPLRGG